MSADLQSLILGVLQAWPPAQVFVLALFIGFCVVFGFTKLKKTAGSGAIGEEPRTKRFPTSR